MNKLYKLDPNHKLIIILCLAGMALLGGKVLYTVSQSTTNQESQKTIPQPIKAVTALGRIEPQGRLIKLAPVPDLGGAKIAQLFVQEGDRLVTGQTIAQLDSYKRANSAVALARQEIKVAQADLAVVEAGAKQGEINAQAANLNRIKAELEGELLANNADIARLQAQLETEQREKQADIDRSLAELRNSTSEFQRYEQLAQDGVISESDLDSRRLTMDTAQTTFVAAQSSYKQTILTLEQEINRAVAIAKQNKDTLREQISEAEANLDSVKEVPKVDILKAQAEVDRAIAALRQAEDDLELTLVNAPNDGEIIKIHAYPGEIVDDDGVVEFAQTKNMMVVAEVYESDIGKVKLGQTATIRSETGAFTEELKGKISRIGLKIGKQDVLNTDPAADVDSRVVEVEIHLDSENGDRVSHLTNSKTVVKINL